MKRLEINYSLGSMDVLVSLARYNFVIKTLPDAGLSVLDYGCGSGYGTRVLKEQYKNVTSFDTYPDGYRPEGIDVVSSTELLQGKSFDIITCFEVIEHMDEKAQHKLMDSLAAMLAPQGSLYVSTVRRMDPPPTENRRKYHVRELTFGELYGFCRERFRNVYTFGQIDQVISTFYRENNYHFVFLCTGKK